MALTSTGFNVFTQIDEFGHFVDGNGLTEFGEYYETGGNQNFDLLATSASNAVTSFKPGSVAELVSTSTSDMGLTPTLSSLETNLLASSSSEALVSIQPLPPIVLPAVSTSSALTTLMGDGTIARDLFATSVSSSMFSIEPVSDIVLLGNSSSNASLLLNSLGSLLLLAQSISYCTSSLTGDGEADLGVFYSKSYSNAETPLSTGLLYLSNPLTEEGFCCCSELDEFGHPIFDTYNDLTDTAKSIFYLSYRGLKLQASSISKALAVLKYQFFKKSYVSVENYPYGTCDISIAGIKGVVNVDNYNYVDVVIEY